MKVVFFYQDWNRQPIYNTSDQLLVFDEENAIYNTSGEEEEE